MRGPKNVLFEVLLELFRILVALVRLLSCSRLTATCQCFTSCFQCSCWLIFVMSLPNDLIRVTLLSFSPFFSSPVFSSLLTLWTEDRSGLVVSSFLSPVLMNRTVAALFLPPTPSIPTSLSVFLTHSSFCLQCDRERGCSSERVIYN